MVDLSKAKAGDTVKFRCGGEATIRGISPRDYNGFIVTMKEYEHRHWYGSNGLSGTDGGEHPLDITAIIPEPQQFDWSTVMSGMAFVDKFAGNVWRFIGELPQDSQWGCFQMKAAGRIVHALFKEHLTRAPEHDVEVG